MKKIICLLLIASFCLSLASCVPNLKRYAVKFAYEKTDLTDFDIEGEAYSAFSEKITEFALRLSEAVCRDSDSGFALSPIAVYMALASAAECASGETRDEILSALGISYGDMTEMTKYIYALCNEEYISVDEDGKESVDAYEMLSSSLWLDTDVIYKGDCVESLARHYGSDVYSAPFSGGNAGKMINQFIEYKTNGFMRGNVDISRSSSLAFINTFYLSEMWNTLGRGLSSTFDQYDFTDDNGNVTRLHLLQSNYSDGREFKTSKFSSFYAQTLHGYKIFFILPEERYSVSDVFTYENIIKAINLNNYKTSDLLGMITYKTRVLFPEFSASFNSSLNDILSENFNIKSVFDDEKCDFSALTDSDVYCKELIHKCVIKLDSKGVCDSSQKISDAVGVSQAADYGEQYKDFVLDRPFGFVLTDTHGNILYTGVVNSLK